jgi:transposase-like protein
MQHEREYELDTSGSWYRPIQVLVNTVMNLHVPQKLSNFFISQKTGSFSKRTLRPSIIRITQLAASFLRYNNDQSASTSETKNRHLPHFVGIKSKNKEMFYKESKTNFTKSKFGNFTRSYISFIMRMAWHGTKHETDAIQGKSHLTAICNNTRALAITSSQKQEHSTFTLQASCTV